MNHRLNPQRFSFDGFNYETTTHRTTRNVFATTTQAWNEYSNNNNNGKDGYENSFSQFSGHETSRPSSGSNSDRKTSTTTGNSRDVYSSNANNNNNRDILNSNSGNSNRETYYNTPKTTSSSTHQSREVYNQDRDIYNQPRETSTEGYGFIADSLANHGNSNNNYNPPVTARSFNQQTTTSNYDYNFNSNNRRSSSTSSTFRPNRDTNFGLTTKRSTYFQGDLPFLNNDETGTSVRIRTRMF